MKASKFILLVLCFILITQLVKSQIDSCDDFIYSIEPSKAFTAVFIVYMFLIIIGAILVLILIKPTIEQ